MDRDEMDREYEKSDQGPAPDKDRKDCSKCRKTFKNWYLRSKHEPGCRVAFITISLENLLGEKSDIETLKDEMDSWKSNMSDNNMENLPKFDEVTEAYETLEQYYDDLDTAIDALIDFCNENEIDLSQTTTMRVDRASGKSRATRMQDAVDSINTAVSIIKDALADDIEEEENETEEQKTAREEKQSERETLRDELEAKCDEVDNAVSELEGVSFPGMF